MAHNPDNFALYVIEALKDPQVLSHMNKGIDLDLVSQNVISTLENRLKTMEAKINQKDLVIDQLKRENNDLHLRLIELEQYSRKNVLKMEGIEERDEEDTFNTVMDLSTSLKLDPL